MEVINQVYPNQPGQIEKMMEPGPHGPIVMVNLLKFKEKAQYEELLNDPDVYIVKEQFAYDKTGKAVIKRPQGRRATVLQSNQGVSSSIL